MDGSGQMKYEFGAIEALAGQIGTQVSSIEQILGDLGNQINQLQNTWQGAANTGFVQTKTNWFQASDDLNQVLKQIQIAVQQTVQDAQSTESKNAARWG
jgi:WXG100 family type VII secretion target